MTDFFKQLKVNYTVSALLCVLLGFVLLIWPGTTTQIVCMVLGAVLLVYGVAQIAVYLFIREKTMISHGMMLLGIILAVIGVWILLKPDMIIMAVPMIIGVLIILHGFHNLTQAISLKKYGYAKWWLALLMGILTVVFGGVLVYNPFEAVELVVRIIGISLIYDGLSDLWIISRVFKVERKIEKEL